MASGNCSEPRAETDETRLDAEDQIGSSEPSVQQLFHKRFAHRDGRIDTPQSYAAKDHEELKASIKDGGINVQAIKVHAVRDDSPQRRLSVQDLPTTSRGW
ncbi:hypothetical protein QTH97_07955 [Variovorax sp. J22R24]|uniref:hypothetical protein n=1 Tax=Variovorax gracilis TaxID=3053502 RepID=UPI00257594CF|nr:hypothetical protein [Variovorax sp. J22R24]MDM0104863.1 hypothetical protein [Variovorax sp. J22R24]